MPSFDVVSEVDLQEVENAVNQANKEVRQRYDFRGSDTRIEWDKKAAISIESSDDFRVKAVDDVLREKLAKRSVPLKALDPQKIEPASSGRAKQVVKLRQGIDADQARVIIKLVKELKLKVQAQIQGDQVRIIGKKRDDLQQAIAVIKAKDLDIPLQFTNFRD